MPCDVRALPKSHLHLHVAGAMRPGTLRELSRRYRLPPPLPPVDDGVHTWAQFQARYDAAREAIRAPDDLARVVTEAAADDADDGCGWLEIQLDPTGYAPALGGFDVELLGATRTGHGTAAANDPATMALLAERRIALEICPTSYPPFAVHELAQVPVATLLDAGVPVAIGSDDPLLFGTGLAGQYAICRDTLGLTDDRLAALARHGVAHSAAPSRVKADLLAGIDTWPATGPA